jgi:hypothetical protein
MQPTLEFGGVQEPVSLQVLKYLLHWFGGTPPLARQRSFPLGVGAFSALFNRYAMLREMLQVGGDKLPSCGSNSLSV